MASGTALSGARLQDYLRQVETRLRSGDLAAAMRLADEAVASGAEHTHLLTLAAQHQLQSSQAERALDLARRARALSPRNVDVLNTVGNALRALGRHREALKLYD